MPKGIPSLTGDQKQIILRRIKENGERVSELAEEFRVVPGTIYNMLRNKVMEPNTVFELAKLKREHEALLMIIGKLIAEQRLGKKM